MEYSGIDVCEIQGNINWKSVSLRGIKFAMLRASYDSSGIDAQFEQNIESISKTQIFAGAYHQCSAANSSEAIKEANHFLSIVKPYKIQYPLAMKYENEATMQIGKNLITDIIISFVKVIESAGYYPILYANVQWIKSYVDVNRIQKLDVWLSDLSVRPKVYPSYDKNVTIWQHSNRGRIPGIKNNVNLDISYADYPLIIQQRGLNKLNNFNKNSQRISEDVESCEPIFYTVEKGDTLRNIAKKTLGNADQYRSIMELNGLMKPIIYPGQTLRIPRCSDPNVLLHRVAPNETLWRISEKYLGYGPRYNEIMAMNGLTTDMIYAGQILKIPIQTPIEPRTYTVRPGDTLWGIAQKILGNGNRYSEIMAINNLQNGNIRVGQVLNIPKR